MPIECKQVLAIGFTNTFATKCQNKTNFTFVKLTFPPNPLQNRSSTWALLLYIFENLNKFKKLKLLKNFEFQAKRIISTIVIISIQKFETNCAQIWVEPMFSLYKGRGKIQLEIRWRLV